MKKNLIKKVDIMPKEIDARGLECPQPVIITKKALEETADIVVIVDNKTARENLQRLADSQGCKFSDEKKDDGIYISISKSGTGKTDSSIDGKLSGESSAQPILVVVMPANTIGKGDDTLGELLVRGFVHTLLETKPLPNSIILLNSGVKLAVKDSETVNDFKELEGKGVQILACGTCLNYFNLTDSLDAGNISNMYEITETMIRADRLVSI